MIDTLKEMLDNKLIKVYKNYTNTAFDIGLIILSVFAIMWFSSYVYNLLPAVIVGFIFAAFIRPVAKVLNKKGFKHKTATHIATWLFILLFVVVLFAAALVFAQQIYKLSVMIPTYAEYFQEGLFKGIDEIKIRMNALSPEMSQKIQEGISLLSSKFAIFASTFLMGLFTALTSMGTLLVNLVFGIIFGYIFCLEINDLNQSYAKAIPNTVKRAFSFLRENVLKGLGAYLKAQFILISITFFIILIGLLIVGAENVLTMALLSALFDVLPILGVPVIFIPWIIYSFVIGKTSFAIGLVAILAITWIVRQIAEPKIAGDALGVSAFIMLLGMYFSLQVFGIAGVFIAPILIILLKQLSDKGLLAQWIRKPKNEYNHI